MVAAASGRGDSHRSHPGLVAATILAVVPLVTIFVLPMAWRLVGTLLGWYLRKKTDGRRHRIIEVMEDEERRFEETNRVGRKESDDDWENIEAYAVGTSGNGEKGQKEWDGIVGFFHPFWLVVTVGPRKKTCELTV
jgi:alpha-1,2-mannosyltransferase